MNPLNDQEVEALLTRVGRGMVPERKRLLAVLNVHVENAPVRSPLSFITLYMSTMTKVGATLAAVLVVGGAVYYLAAPGGTAEVSLQENSADSSMAMKVAESTSVPLVPATGSVEDIAAAIDADLASQNAAVASIDASTNASVSNISAVTTNPLYDENNI